MKGEFSVEEGASTPPPSGNPPPTRCLEVGVLPSAHADEKEFKEYLEKEEQQSFSGWDFSYINGRREEASLPWCYRDKIAAFIKQDTQLLDMGTGGGEFLLSLRHPYQLTSVTEGYEPNYKLCKQRLEPLGISVHKCEGSEALPFEDAQFDVVINRHESYDVSEIFRILRPNGFFITQQVGGRNNSNLSQRLLPSYKPKMPDFNLENQLLLFARSGFRIMYRNQSYIKSRFNDVGAICYYAKIIPWEFPGFSVETCFDRLRLLQQEVEDRGFLETENHRFVLVVKKNAMTNMH